MIQVAFLKTVGGLLGECSALDATTAQGGDIYLMSMANGQACTNISRARLRTYEIRPRVLIWNVIHFEKEDLSMSDQYWLSED